jgi:tRNA-dihydrouridine synthase 3
VSSHGPVSRADPRYLIPAETTLIRSAPDDDAAEASKDCRAGGDEKRQKTKGGWKARTKGQKPVFTGERSVRMCSGWEKTGKCPFGDKCKYAHSWDAYFAVKPQDIHYARGELAEEAPFAATTERQGGGDDAIGKTVDLATTCPVYAELGYCTFGWRCRFLGGHVKKAEVEGEDSLTRVGGWELLGFPDMDGSREGRNREVNWAKVEVLHSLQKSKVS